MIKHSVKTTPAELAVVAHINNHLPMWFVARQFGSKQCRRMHRLGRLVNSQVRS